MSKTLSAAAQQQFDDMVLQEFQGTGFLRNTVTIRNNVVGDIYKFRHMGKGMANQKPSQADVTPMDVNHSLINCTLENWNAPEYTDIFDQTEVNFDEQSELAEAISSALGRRLDQLIIDACDAEASPAATIAHGSTALSFAKVNQANTALVKKGVPAGDRTFLLTGDGLEDLLAETEVNSSDYNTVQALMSAKVNDGWMGFNWRVIEDRDEGGIPVTTGNAESFVYHKKAVGLAIGMDIKAEVNYIAQKTSWLCNGVMRAGAVSRNGNGIVSIGWVE